MIITRGDKQRNDGRGQTRRTEEQGEGETQRRTRKGRRKREKEEVEHKEEAREIAVAIGGPVIKNQLTSQLPCESRTIIKCARNRKRLFWNDRMRSSRNARGETSSLGTRRLCDLARKEALCFP